MYSGETENVMNLKNKTEKKSKRQSKENLGHNQHV